MLKQHMDNQESVLLKKFNIQNIAGHPNHKGGPREFFIKEFLEAHLPENIAIGTGEIIDSQSYVGQKRNQFDIVLYKKNYPKISLGGDINAFLIESVIATVEIKSTLTSGELENAIHAAANAKKLIPNFHSSFFTGYIPPKILNYVLAYNGPAQTATALNWIKAAHQKLNLVEPVLPEEFEARQKIPAVSVDGVFVLEKGFLLFDNSPLDIAQKLRLAKPSCRWVLSDSPNGNLLIFFLLLQMANANIEGRWLNPIPYVSSVVVNGVSIS